MPKARFTLLAVSKAMLKWLLALVYSQKYLTLPKENLFVAYNFNRINDSKIFPSNSDYLKVKDQFHLYDLLNDCWCLDTCAPRLRNDWSENNKTCGQCSITAFLVQDIFGGEVYGIETASGIHCFNKVGEIIFDLTSEQFKNSNELSYKLNNLQKREIHFANEEKYNRYLLLVGLLKSRLIDLN